MKTFQENPNVIDGLIYLKVNKEQISAYGDMASLQAAEDEMKTGRLFDFSVTSEEWNMAECTARIVNGKVVLGLPPDIIAARQEDAIRTERDIRYANAIKCLQCTGTF